MNKEQLYEDYLPDDDIFNEEEEKVHKTKHIIFDKLTEPERRIIVLYAELQSVRKVGKLLGISPASAWIAVDKIRNKIKDLYDS